LIGLDAANLFPAIDDDEVEVYWLAADKINLSRRQGTSNPVRESLIAALASLSKKFALVPNLSRSSPQTVSDTGSIIQMKI